MVGVQYSKVRFKLFSSNDLDRARLEPNQWKYFIGQVKHGAEDMLEASLAEDMEVGDLEMQMWDGFLEGDEYIVIT